MLEAYHQHVADRAKLVTVFPPELTKRPTLKRDF